MIAYKVILLSLAWLSILIIMGGALLWIHRTARILRGKVIRA